MIRAGYDGPDTSDLLGLRAMTDILLGVYVFGYFVAVAYVLITERGSGYSIAAQAGAIGIFWPLLLLAIAVERLREHMRERGDSDAF